MTNRIVLALKVSRQLGLEQTALYALYRFGLWSGHYRRSTPSPHDPENLKAPLQVTPELATALFNHYPLLLEDLPRLLSQADDICSGRFSLFGGKPVPLMLVPGDNLVHWTQYELGYPLPADQVDIKFIWEPTRFSWTYPLGRAYTLTKNEAYAQFFWSSLETFLEANPPYFGPNWISGQEVALRLMAFVFAASAFALSPHSTPQHMQLLSQAVAEHAQRIPLTLVYARSQNNNHVLSEAAGLYTAGLALPGHKKAENWRRQGWKWINHALQSQIAGDGTYVQHSTNYHRLVLQLSLWIDALKTFPVTQPIPGATLLRLAAASRWLQGLVDPLTGQVPGLGANDGAYLMPLTPEPFSDFRPVSNAAIHAWIKESLQPGMVSQPGFKDIPSKNIEGHPIILETQKTEANIRAFLYCARYSSRPSHADQLHLDLWWRGINLAIDPGTYLYNAPPPWQNALASTSVHNTVMIDNHDQMTRGGRFLWLDWAQARIISKQTSSDGKIIDLTARHDGYSHLGVIHQRRARVKSADCLIVTDDLLPATPADSNRIHSARLQWLLPDWPWSFENDMLFLTTIHGSIRLEIKGTSHISLVRAGQNLTGSEKTLPISGWCSPTYGEKVPALALVATSSGPLPFTLTTTWHFPP